MKHILCYGDSNTWGQDPTTLNPATGSGLRHPDHVRWPNVMGSKLGADYKIHEAGLCGRTTVYDDPIAYGRNGLWHFEVAYNSCMPVDCVIVMLGTNDTKDMFASSPTIIAYGIERLVFHCQDVIRRSLSPDAKLVLACPVVTGADRNGTYWFGFTEEATRKGEALREIYRNTAARMGCAFFDVNDVACADPGDGVHLSAESHRSIGEALADVVRSVLESE